MTVENVDRWLGTKLDAATPELPRHPRYLSVGSMRQPSLTGLGKLTAMFATAAAAALLSVGGISLYQAGRHSVGAPQTAGGPPVVLTPPAPTVAGVAPAPRQTPAATTAPTPTAAPTAAAAVNAPAPAQSAAPPAPTPTTACKVSSGPDTQAPSPASNLQMTGQTTSSISLAWNSATDNVGVCRYEVWRGDANYNNWVLVVAVTGDTLSFTDTKVSRNTTYTYGIRAFDAAGNKSASSNVITASTLP